MHMCIVYVYILFFLAFIFSSSLLRVNAMPTQEPAVAVRQRARDPSLVMALVKSYGFLLFIAGFLKLGSDLLTFVSPQILK